MPGIWRHTRAAPLMSTAWHRGDAVQSERNPTPNTNEFGVRVLRSDFSTLVPRGATNRSNLLPMKPT